MRGYGRHFGYGHGWGYGWYNRPSSWESEDYEYLGPCRCGFGPDAFWRNKKTGRIVRGFPPPVWREPEGSAEDLRKELEFLLQEKEKLEKRLAQIEEKFGRKKNEND